MTTQNVAYYSSVTEYESGWGSRPDGYLVALTKEDFKTKADSINSYKGEEFSRVDNEPKLCLITDEMFEKLNAQKVIWTDNKRTWLVEG